MFTALAEWFALIPNEYIFHLEKFTVFIFKELYFVFLYS